MVLELWAMAKGQPTLVLLGRKQHRTNADGSGNSPGGAASVGRLALQRAEPLAREEMLGVRAVTCLGCLARTLMGDDQIQW